LVANAIKYAPGSDISLRTFSANGRATVIVEDYGPGIPEQLMKTLFEPITEDSRGKDGGLSLGLYVAKTIVDAHGGKIDLKSHTGKGSILTVELPL
jgi:signal transduction histidine kinase